MEPLHLVWKTDLEDTSSQDCRPLPHNTACRYVMLVACLKHGQYPSAGCPDTTCFCFFANKNKRVVVRLWRTSPLRVGKQLQVPGIILIVCNEVRKCYVPRVLSEC